MRTNFRHYLVIYLEQQGKSTTNPGHVNLMNMKQECQSVNRNVQPFC